MTQTLSSSTIKVSILIPMYNMEKFIIRALDSIPKRDDIEIIIVDDCSTDDSARLVREYPRDITLFCHKENTGVSTTMDDAVRLAKGEYLYQLDPDDYLYTGNFEKAMEQLDGTDMVFVDAIVNNGQKLHEDHKNGACAVWFKFIRREFHGDYKREQNYYGGDRELDEYLYSIPHTEKQTNLIVYHYNFPRQGSISWNASHSR